MDSTTFKEPPIDGNETDTVLGILDRTRSVLAWKTGGLDRSGLSATVGRSSVTLGGLLKHLAFVEDYYFSTKLFGRDPGSPWNAVDWDAEPEWPWTSAAGDSPDDLYALWQAAVARSRVSVGEALGNGDMGQLVAVSGSDGRHSNLRRLLLDLIDEYARHNGQADLIRESVDGLVGEDPPG